MFSPSGKLDFQIRCFSCAVATLNIVVQKSLFQHQLDTSAAIPTKIFLTLGIKNEFISESLSSRNRLNRKSVSVHGAQGMNWVAKGICWNARENKKAYKTDSE